MTAKRIEQVHRYRKKFKEKHGISRGEVDRRAKLRSWSFQWNGNPNSKENRPIWRNVEVQAVKILEKEGFINIYHVSEDCHNFPFDYLAEKDFRGYGIQVTMDYYFSWTQARFQKTLRLAAWLGIEPLGLCVNHDLTEYLFRKAR